MLTFDKRKRWYGLCFLAMGLLVAMKMGCSGEASRPCSSVADCLGGESCTDSRCEVTRTCQQANDCMGDEQCLSGRCRPPGFQPQESNPGRDGGTADQPGANDRPTPSDQPGLPDQKPPADQVSVDQPAPDRSAPPDTRSPVTPGSRFASGPMSWDVPTATFCAVAYASGDKYWSVFDLDGDGKPDLVWTRDPSTSMAFTTGGPHWKVFKNTGSGFAKQPIDWKVPTPTFDRTAYASGSKYWSVFDIDGDGKPDLVWTRDPDGATAFMTGGPHWKVFNNTGSGFAQQPVSWKVPAEGFDRTAYASGSKYWSVLDIDGDSKPDLVWTRDPDGATAFMSGGPHWKVFNNTGSGFAQQPSSWKVPAEGFDRTFQALGSKYWSVIDLDGDGKPELVWTRDPNASTSFTTGGPHWKVFQNTGSGFAQQPTDWKVPTPTFDRTAYASGSKYWSVFDIDGDGKPDLVWTRDPDGATAFMTGGPHWKVFNNTGSSFSPQPVSWKVPAEGFDRTAYASGSKYWSVFDLDGDRKPDLVWTRDPDAPSCASFSSGSVHWKIFKNQ